MRFANSANKDPAVGAATERKAPLAVMDRAHPDPKGTPRRRVKGLDAVAEDMRALQPSRGMPGGLFELASPVPASLINSSPMSVYPARGGGGVRRELNCCGTARTLGRH